MRIKEMYGRGAMTASEKDKKIAKQFCDTKGRIDPKNIWQVYDYGDGTACVTVSGTIYDDTYYFDYANNQIISSESDYTPYSDVDENDEDFNRFIDNDGPFDPNWEENE